MNIFFFSNLKKQHVFLVPILVVYVVEIIVYVICLIKEAISPDAIRGALRKSGYKAEKIEPMLIPLLILLLILICMRNRIYSYYRFSIIYADTFAIFSFQDLLHARHI